MCHQVELLHVPEKTSPDKWSAFNKFCFKEGSYSYDLNAASFSYPDENVLFVWQDSFVVMTSNKNFYVWTNFTTFCIA